MLLLNNVTDKLRVLFGVVFLRTYKIQQIVSEITDISQKEGWGGKHISSFPPTRFFKQYISGNRKEAKKNMMNWYYKRSIKDKLFLVDKACGGMAGGSLFRTVEKLHKHKGIKLKEDLSNIDRDLVKKGIKKRVEERFLLLKSIIKNRFLNKGAFISLKKEHGRYILIDGHHRAAAMAACGYLSLPAYNKNSLIKFITKIFRR